MNCARSLCSPLAFALALSGCFGTDTGNPPVTASLVGRSSEPGVAVAPGAAPVVVDGAWVSLESVRAVLGAGCDHVSEPTDADVVGDVVGVVPLAGLPAGESCGVHLVPRAASPLPPGAPAALEGRTLLVTGTRADGAPFELTADDVAPVDVAAGAPFVLSDGEGAWIAFDVAVWLAGVDLDAIVLHPDGVARVEPGDPEAPSLAAGFAASVGVYADAGGDGVFGPDEEAAGPLATSHP